MIDGSTPERLAGASHELDLTRRLSLGEAQRPSGRTDSGGAHFPRVVDGWATTLAAAEAQACAASAAAAAATAATTPAVCLAMEPLHESAAAVLAHARARGRRGLPLGTVRALARDALAALDALHTCGRVAHRDVKPSNLLLARPLLLDAASAATVAAHDRTLSRRRQHRAVAPLAELRAAAPWALADFGSAAPLVPRWRWRWPSSSAGAAWAPPLPLPRLCWEAADPGDAPPYETPAYSPPEALLALPCTPAWDVWQLGCALYEAATGDALFGPALEAAAAAHAAGLGSSGSSDSESSDDGAGAALGWWRPPRGAQGAAATRRSRRHGSRLDVACDRAHLAAMRRLLGPPPWALLRASPVAADFFDARGELLPRTAAAAGAGAAARDWRPLERRLAERLPPAEAARLAAFLAPLLAYDAAARPTARALLSHPWLRDNDDGGGGGDDDGA